NLKKCGQKKTDRSASGIPEDPPFGRSSGPNSFLSGQVGAEPAPVGHFQQVRLPGMNLRAHPGQSVKEITLSRVPSAVRAFGTHEYRMDLPRRELMGRSCEQDWIEERSSSSLSPCREIPYGGPLLHIRQVKVPDSIDRVGAEQARRQFPWPFGGGDHERHGVLAIGKPANQGLMLQVEVFYEKNLPEFKRLPGNVPDQRPTDRSRDGTGHAALACARKAHKDDTTRRERTFFLKQLQMSREPVFESAVSGQMTERILYFHANKQIRYSNISPRASDSHPGIGRY